MKLFRVPHPYNYYMEKKIPTNTITRDIKYLAQPTGNIYETVVILSKRANQIAVAEKKELAKKLEDFRNAERDTIEDGDLYYRTAQEDAAAEK
mgnify:CR=1 FL=1